MDRSIGRTVTLIFVCVAAIVVVTQWNAKQNDQEAIDLKESVLAGKQNLHSWEECSRFLSSAKPIKDGSVMWVSDDGVEHVSQANVANDAIVTRLASVWAKPHESIRSDEHPSEGMMVFPDLTVVVADVPSCSVKKTFLSGDDDYHPELNRLYIESDRKCRRPCQRLRRLRDKIKNWGKKVINRVKDGAKKLAACLKAKGQCVPDGYHDDPNKDIVAPNTNVPCTIRGYPVDCTSNRIKDWNSIKNHNACKHDKTFIRSGSAQCENVPWSWRITHHLCDNTDYCVKFTGKDGSQWGVIMKAGENWGKNPLNDQDYGCQGRCGPGCAGKGCSNWSRLCLLHDVCSWYYGGKGLVLSENCGDEYRQAAKDYIHNCYKSNAPCRGPLKEPPRKC